MKKTIQLIIINIFVFVFLLALLEVGSRLIFKVNDAKPIFNDQSLRTRGRPFVELDAHRGFALKSGFKNELYSVNSAGFRGEELPDNLKEKNLILAMGESTTFGWGVKDQETYPFYLNQLLTSDSDMVINAGIPSYTSSQVLAYLQEIIQDQKVKPNILMINILWNDIWYSSVKNWHPDILIYQKPPSWLVFLSQHSRLFNILYMGKSSNELVDVFNEKALSKYKQNLQEMVDIAQQEGIKLIFVNPPFDADHLTDKGLDEFQVQYTKSYLIEMAKLYLVEMNKIAEANNIPVLSHQLDIRFLHQKDLFLDALHPTPEGNKLMATDIYHQLKNSF